MEFNWIHTFPEGVCCLVQDLKSYRHVPFGSPRLRIIYIYIYIQIKAMDCFLFKILKWRRSSLHAIIFMSGSRWWRKYSKFAQALSTILLVILRGCVRFFVAVCFIYINSECFLTTHPNSLNQPLLCKKKKKTLQTDREGKLWIQTC